MSTAATAPPAASASNETYPDLTSPTDSVIAGDFGAMSAMEQESQRDEWKDELKRTDEEINTLRQVLMAKEATAAGLKRRLGITAWREFSEDMTQGLRNLQDSEAYKKTADGMNVAKEKAAGMWTSVTTSTSFQNMSIKAGSMFGAAKAKMSQSMSQQNFQENQEGTNGATATPEKIPEEAEPKK